MAITFNPVSKRIILDSTSVSATELYSRSCDWLALSDNMKYGPVFRQVGGDDLGGGLLIPPYFFLQGDWRVRPMETSHMLSIVGNLFVDGGGVPVVNTIGTFNVLTQFTVPVQAQAFESGGGSIYTPEQIADAVWANTDGISVVKLLGNKVVRVGDVITVYEADEITVWRQYDLADGGRALL